jgi:phenol 2-monooxygenase
VYSELYGSVLIVPRERNMTRLYIELKAGPYGEPRNLDESFVMQQAKRILAPYSLNWKMVEWFGRYQMRQRVASRFCDPKTRIFLAGDASHTHSPKAAQGMNTSIHDSLNLAWKLNLAVRGLAKPIVLESYEEERQKIAYDLKNFDYEHANQIAGGDPVALANNFKTNIRFISGVGVEYGQSIINSGEVHEEGSVRPGCLLPPAKVTRYIDANPVDLQLDIPMLGQFKIFLFVPDVQSGMAFLETFCAAVSQSESLISQLSLASAASYTEKPRPPVFDDAYTGVMRYTTVSQLFTFALISKL